MLKVNVGLSRKLSKDYNSTGFTVNIEGEITAPTSDPQAVIEQVKELYDLAEESLDQQIERTKSIDAVASRDETGRQRRSENGNGRRESSRNGNGNGNGHDQQRASQQQNGNGDVPATNKQVSYLLSIGRRQRLSTVQLEEEIAKILGEQIGVYDLTKSEAARIIDALTSSQTTRSNGRY